MFGLTKREQRWKAEQRAAELLVHFASTVVRATADVQAAEAGRERLLRESAELRAELAALKAAPATDWETRAELAEQQVVCLAEERDHWKAMALDAPKSSTEVHADALELPPLPIDIPRGSRLHRMVEDYARSAVCSYTIRQTSLTTRSTRSGKACPTA